MGEFERGEVFGDGNSGRQKDHDDDDVGVLEVEEDKRRREVLCYDVRIRSRKPRGGA